MLTIDALKNLGADTESGIARCVGNEGFYLRMVTMALQDTGFEQLIEAIEAGDLDTAFERAHALKGTLGNVSLTNLFEPISEMTEELRVRKAIDYSGYIEQISTALDQYRALL